MIDAHHLIDYGTEVVAISSVLHTILPPWEAFNDFPTLQKYYKLFIFIVGYAALNGRSTIYRTISTDSGQTPSDAAASNPNTPPVPTITVQHKDPPERVLP